MKKSLLGIKPYYYLIIIGVALIGFIVGSFADLSIAQGLYNPDNGVARFTESWVIGISFMMIPAAGGYILAASVNEKRLWLKIVGIGIAIACYVAMIFIYRGFVYNKNQSGTVTYENVVYGLRVNSTFLSYFLPAIIMLIPLVLCFFLADKAHPYRLWRIGLIIIVAFALEHGTAELIKYLAMRPRYRYIYSDLNTLGTVFRNWWEWLPYSMTKGDCFKSFPSGHTGAACVTLLSPLLVSGSKYRFKHDTVVFFCLAACFVVFVAIFRMVAGAHYLSDVSAGALISSSLSLLVLYLGVKKICPEKNEEVKRDEVAA